MFENILKKRPDLDRSKLERTRSLMNQAVPDCLVSGFESLIDGLSLPDPNDRHVLAAAIRCNAQTIVTFNLDDFPEQALAPYHIEAQHPDDFVVHQIHLNAPLVVGTIIQQARDLKRPQLSVDDVLGSLERVGLVEAVTLLRDLMPR